MLWDCLLGEMANYIMRFQTFDMCSTTVFYFTQIRERVEESALKANTLLTVLIMPVSTRIWNNSNSILSKPSALGQILSWDSRLLTCDLQLCITKLLFVCELETLMALKAKAMLTFLIFSVPTCLWNYSNAILSKPSTLGLFPQKDGKFYHEILDFWRVFHNIELLDSYWCASWRIGF